MLGEAEFDIKKEAAWAISNATSGGRRAPCHPGGQLRSSRSPHHACVSEGCSVTSAGLFCCIAQQPTVHVEHPPCSKLLPCDMLPPERGRWRLLSIQKPASKVRQGALLRVTAGLVHPPCWGCRRCLRWRTDALPCLHARQA